jgi:uncharacterized protein YjfI (DUF2170 family)
LLLLSKTGQLAVRGCTLYLHLCGLSATSLLLLLLLALTPLYHEALDVSMEDDAIIVVAGTQR